MTRALDSVHDLPAAEGRYHRTCYAEFFREAHSHTPGRPQTHEKSTAFERLCDHIDSSSECQYSISELESMLCDFVLWISGHTIQATPHPSWAGFMQSAMQNTGTYDVSEITTLPFINMDPSDCSTTYTALCYARAKCDKAGQ